MGHRDKHMAVFLRSVGNKEKQVHQWNFWAKEDAHEGAKEQSEFIN